MYGDDDLRPEQISLASYTQIVPSLFEILLPVH
jgi:hypothetical protein